jgi:anti-anti-sigma regulatory factor
LREIGGIAEGGDAASDLKLVFDLEKVQYASSVFLRIVVMAAKRVKKGNFAVSGASPFARDMLKTAALEQLLGRPFGDTE